MFSKVNLLILCGFILSGCADVSVSKKEAVDKFINRAENEAKLYDAIKEDVAPKKQLIKFNYGPDSFKDNTFLDYLSQSNANLESSLVKELKIQEGRFQLNEKNQKSSIDLFKNKITVYKKLLTRVQVNYADISLKQSIESLCRNAQLQCSVEITADKKIRENLSGSIWQIFSRIAKSHNLNFGLSLEDMATIKFSTTSDLKASAIADLAVKQNTLLSIQYEKDILSDLNQLEEYLDVLAENAKLDLEGYELKTSEAKNMLQQFISDLNEVSYETEKLKEASEFRKKIINQSQNLSELDKAPSKTVSYFDNNIKPGQELIIQKFSIYNQKPEDLGKSLKAYSIFQKPGCKSQTSAPGVPVTGNNNQTPSNPSNKNSSQAAATPSGENTQNSSNNIATNQPSNPSTGAQANQSNQSSQRNMDTPQNVCLALDIESDGVIATGLIQDVKILEKFLTDQDRPLKQVMIEAYILEVTNDWARKIQSKISNSGGSVLSVAGMNAVPSLTNGVKFASTFGSKSEIEALINLIETNSIGRKISNPVILVQDGQTGTVDKTRTVYEILTTTVPGAVGTNNTITQEAKPLPSPLKLSVTPTVNKHNDNISLKFDFTETVRDSDTYTSPTTANQITTTLNVEPGAVVMMAGLRKETNAITSNGIPGLSKLGLSSIFSPLTALLGGENNRSTSGSELLVLINPSVITSKGLKNTIEKAK